MPSTVTHDAAPYATAAALRKLPNHSVLEFEMMPLFGGDKVRKYREVVQWHRDAWQKPIKTRRLAAMLRSPRLIAFTLVIPEARDEQ